MTAANPAGSQEAERTGGPNPGNTINEEEQISRQNLHQKFPDAEFQLVTQERSLTSSLDCASG